MKAILEFNLPEDQTEYQVVNDAPKMFSVLWDMKQWLRGQLKFPENMNLSDDGYQVLEQCRDKLNELLMDNNLDLDV